MSSDEDQKTAEESKGTSGTIPGKSSGPATPLPDMWNHTDGKRGDGYLIFGAPPKTSGGSQ